MFKALKQSYSYRSPLPVLNKGGKKGTFYTPAPISDNIINFFVT